MWRTSISWLWTFTSSNFMNIPNELHKSPKPSGSHILNFLASLFCTLCLLILQNLVVGEGFRTRSDIIIDLEAM